MDRWMVFSWLFNLSFYINWLDYHLAFGAWQSCSSNVGQSCSCWAILQVGLSFTGGVKSFHLQSFNNHKAWTMTIQSFISFRKVCKSHLSIVAGLPPKIEVILCGRNSYCIESFLSWHFETDSNPGSWAWIDCHEIDTLTSSATTARFISSSILSCF